MEARKYEGGDIYINPKDKVINPNAIGKKRTLLHNECNFIRNLTFTIINTKKFTILADSGDNPTAGGIGNRIDVLEYAKKMEENGAGELLVTSMDRDGTQVGYDIDLMSKISSQVNIPVIASGGVGNLDHLVDGIKLGKASAVLAASIFHYGKHSVKEAKDYLDSKGIPVRI